MWLGGVVVYQQAQVSMVWAGILRGLVSVPRRRAREALSRVGSSTAWTVTRYQAAVFSRRLTVCFAQVRTMSRSVLLTPRGISSVSVT